MKWLILGGLIIALTMSWQAWLKIKQCEAAQSGPPLIGEGKK